MKYVLDANIFIEAYKRYYHNQIVSSFWQWLINDEEIYTIKRVKEGVKDGNDGLFKLMEGIKEVSAQVQNFNIVANHVQNHYTAQQEIDKFLSKADPLLVATGIDNTNIIIITSEVSVGKDSTKIKIPNICQELEVNYQIEVFDILKSKPINLSEYP